MGGYTGIDVSRDRLEICVRLANENRTFDNSPSGVAAFIRSGRSVSLDLIVGCANLPIALHGAAMDHKKS